MTNIDNISAEISFNDGPSLTVEQEDEIRDRGIQWVEWNRRASRVMWHLFVTRGDIGWLHGRFTSWALNPIWISRFNAQNGKRVLGTTIDVAEFILVAPDIIGPGDPPVISRPTEYAQTIGFAGWPMHVNEEED